MNYKVEKTNEYPIELNEIPQVGDEILFGKEILEFRRFGMKVLDVETRSAKVLKTAVENGKSMAILKVSGEEDLLILLDKTILRYGAYRKEREEIEDMPEEEPMPKKRGRKKKEE